MTRLTKERRQEIQSIAIWMLHREAESALRDYEETVAVVEAERDAARAEVAKRDALLGEATFWLEQARNELETCGEHLSAELASYNMIAKIDAALKED